MCVGIKMKPKEFRLSPVITYKTYMENTTTNDWINFLVNRKSNCDLC